MTSDVTLHSALSCMYKNLINRHFIPRSTLPRPFPAFQSFFNPLSHIQQISSVLQVGSDEGTESSLADVGVDTRCVGCSAAITPRNSAKKDLGGLVDDGAAGVALARVLSTLRQTSTEHLGGNGRCAVGGLAGAARDNRDVDLEEVDGERLAAR
jgi:hypothetical protein